MKKSTNVLPKVVVIIGETKITNNTKKLLNCSRFRNSFQLKLISYRNHSNDLLCKSVDWFLYNARFYWKVFLNWVYKIVHYFQDFKWKIQHNDWPRGKKIHNLNWASACISTFTSASQHCIARFKSFCLQHFTWW